MAELSTLARPYAKAAFDAALSANELADWSKSLATLAAVSEHDRVQEVLANPSLTTKAKSDSLVSVCGDDLTANAKNLVATLAENKRLELLPEIAEQYELLKAEQEKSVEVQVTSAFELTADQEKNLSQKLKAKLGRDVNLVTTVDDNMIGGVIIRANDLVIDGSVKGKLAKLAEAMYS